MVLTYITHNIHASHAHISPEDHKCNQLMFQVFNYYYNAGWRTVCRNSDDKLHRECYWNQLNKWDATLQCDKLLVTGYELKY